MIKTLYNTRIKQLINGYYMTPAQEAVKGMERQIAEWKELQRQGKTVDVFGVSLKARIKSTNKFIKTMGV